MIREREIYETSDGKRFDDRHKAVEHVADAVREALDAKLQPLQDSGKLSASERYSIVMAIIPDADAAKALHTHLARWINF